jgi:hypothetical protein
MDATPAVSYLGSLDLDKEDMIQALGLSFTVSPRSSAWRLAEPSAAVSASGHSGGFFSARCWR